MARLPDLTERMSKIRLARYIGVAPDWFDHVHPAWEDAAAIARLLDQKIAIGPEIETWAPGQQQPGQKPPILH